ncbi:Rieske (2Fe-2S) domain protein [Rhizorhabdus wittichii RW1]|jgi:nitrite reductase/ring-hydroxylating ferredoxin subunit|uniref:Rieske (2Fe-2S) domain protein n=1 Tax=Rhizorhabdus wittichii (strain DSM 6014 / CCUG 31198 / JCM 15750 / NBRC 105917 / EY 4224 / RW1) TaxID=392499 RepID=A0A9J9LCG8_RHIWR|nr:Rieske (2Fe-2S) domain protein [Rhizorhabdus wittichii RW1]
MNQTSYSATTAMPPEPAYTRLPAEGEDGLFSQSWFVVCRSEDVGPGQIVGRPFLDGRVVVARDESGAVQVLSAYCPHMGASLEAGDVVEGQLRCAFHHWRYDLNGFCKATAIGDPAPGVARLFKFPTVERWGLIMAFNGVEPLWELPDFRHVGTGRVYRDDELYITTTEANHAPVDPWTVCTNTLDIQHIKTLHGLSFTRSDEEVITGMRWTPNDVTFELQAQHWEDRGAHFGLGIHGTTFFYQSLVLDGNWFGLVSPMAMPRPGYTIPYFVLATSLEDGMEAAVAANEAAVKLELDFYAQDRSVLESIRFRAGTLTRSDKALAQFLTHMRAYPRAHPSARFIV